MVKPGPAGQTAIRLIICNACSTDDPFLCPVRFRRTYMRMHLEKSHGVDLRSAKLVRSIRESRSIVAEWVTADEPDQARVLLTEFDVDMPAALSSIESSTGSAPESSENQWTRETLSSLYSVREGDGATF